MQQRWHPDPDEHEAALAAGIQLAAGEGAQLVCLQELTLSRYFAVDPAGPEAAGAEPEELPGGPTYRFAARMAAETGVHVHASLYERADGERRARLQHRDRRRPRRRAGRPHPQAAHPGHRRLPRGPLLPARPAGADAFPVLALGEARLGLPTCWDQWFPELARAYSLAGAEVLVYPTAIGSEPDHPDFDTEPLWQQVIVANGIANGTFMVAVNRIGDRAAAQLLRLLLHLRPLRPRPRPGAARRAGGPRRRPRPRPAPDWLELFPFLTTRRPDAYAPLGLDPTMPAKEQRKTS